MFVHVRCDVSKQATLSIGRKSFNTEDTEAQRTTEETKVTS
jgi:hypothetical protein